MTNDADSLDRLLDDPRLFSRLLEAPRLLNVSPFFFYYIVVRRVFLEHGIDEGGAVADYVGALLSHHLETRRRDNEPPSESVYLIDLVSEMAEASDPEQEFALQAEIGNRALFLSGVFPDWIYYRSIHGRRSVSLAYYEDMGRLHYAAASRSRIARRHSLGEVLGFMADRFPVLRQALNDLVDEHLHLGRQPLGSDRLCRQAMYRVRN
ncbi:MAG: hypothetical protein P8Y29_02565 [Gemmatimonadota bacterium]